MNSPALGKRAQNRQRMETDILRRGRRQLAEVGAAALSLRAIARDLGVASSAVYRYVASRDELLTKLIVESYDELADTVQAAESAVDRADLARRWRALAHAMRTWALEHPHDWSLLYGSPVPGYAAPADQTNSPGTRVTALAIRVLMDAVTARRTAPASRRAIPSAAAIEQARAMLAAEKLTEAQLPPDILLAGLSAWTVLIGAVNSEIFEYLGPVTGDSLGRFDYAMSTALMPILRDV